MNSFFFPSHRFSSQVLTRAELLLLALVACFPSAGLPAVEETAASYVEPEFQFFSSVLDARNLGTGWPTNNLTPRGLILNLGNDCWACFDIDLLRMAAIWQGRGITPVGMAQGSYQKTDRKAPEGQSKLPQIVGIPWMANGIYAGWQADENVSLKDPREPGPDEHEVGRGPLPGRMGRFKAVRPTESGICLEYEVNGAFVQEWVESDVSNGRRVVRRRFRVERGRAPLWLLLGHKASGEESGVRTALIENQPAGKSRVTKIEEPGEPAIVRVAPSAEPIEFSVILGTVPFGGNWESSGRAVPLPSTGARWPQSVVTHGKLSQDKAAFVMDDIPLPLDNPWRRNVRLADLAFFKDGRAAAVSFDGDVWIIRGLKDRLDSVHWKRFASGLHEPLSLCIRDENVFVFDRNGIWRLRDADGNDEADTHELFSNAFAQTAETREYANSMKLAPDGSFVISKGGQQSATLGKHNGSVLRISVDGKTSAVIGWGLRQPFLGIHPETGMVTASDQQGHYVPATPLHIIGDHRYFGYLAGLQPREKYPAPIADPLTWVPHTINASGATQVWLSDARMGPLNDALIHIGYNRPELFLVRLNARGSRLQAAVVNFMRDLDFAPLNAAVNPVDGQLYVIGFQIWGTTAKRISGLARVRHTGAPTTLPREVAPMENGILLRFDTVLDTLQATNPENYSVERWNYRRTPNYGSPHFKLDGSAGQDWMTPSSAYLSRDGKSVFVGIPDMKPVMQMRIGWALETREETAFAENAYFTPYELTKFNPTVEGFEAVKVDLSPRTSHSATTPVTVDEGRRLAALMGCTACHSLDGTTEGKVGPTWKGLFGSQRDFTDGSKTMADESYLRQSLLDPVSKVVVGYEKNDTGMPSYAGVLTDDQIQALILFIKTLK